MKVLVVSDFTNENTLGFGLKEEVLRLLGEGNCEYVHYDMAKEDYHYCAGCFNCWIKTPGRCILKDDMYKVSDEIVKSDVVLILTRVRYGSYSPDIKRMLDRSIPNILPFFKIIKNEMHHAPRYPKYPELFMLGYGEDITEEEETTFRELSNANAVNMQKDSAEVYICRNKADVSKSADKLKAYLQLREEAVV